MKSRLRRGVAIAGAFLFAGIGAACSRAPVAARPQRPPQPVQLVRVADEALPRTLSVNGVLAAQEELVLGLQVGGRLLELPVDTGDVVAAGDLVARLDPRDFELEHARADAALRAAHARLGIGAGDDLGGVDPQATAPVREARAVLDEAKLSRDRIAELVQQQLRPPADLETADAALAVAMSRRQRALEEVQALLAEAAEARVLLAQADKRRHDAVLVAPWPGRIAARHATAGEVVTAGAPIVTLVRNDPLRLRLPVPERAAAEVAIGQRVSFTVDGQDGVRREGLVARLGAVVDRDNRTRLVEATIPNDGGVLLPGAFCRAEIVVEPLARARTLPKAAVVTFAGVARVFAVDAGKGGEPPRARGLVVELGRDLGDRWEIRAGVDAGTEVVGKPGDLRHGDAVVVGG
ncbi:MAG: efflux RND transporter periplasmic adaptor subunit [Planctomycetes bacterium]|nr:efflux RND transporter periplasmic adaptor subunit [Planctomycetota bacterium]